jgi:YD repeat-containing protein
VEVTGRTEFRVMSGGQLDLTGSTVTGIAEDYIEYTAGSHGQIRYTSLGLPLYLNSAATVAIQDSDFSEGTVTASGPTTGIIDLTHNYWGTTDQDEIEDKITHKPDAPANTRSLVVYDPWLLAAPSQTLLYVLSVAPSRPVNVLQDHVDITLNRPVDLATLTPSDVAVFGAVKQYTPTTVSLASGQTYRVLFDSPLPAGTYRIEIGPQIADGAGNLMNQDLDDMPGETWDDVFATTVTFDVTPPRIKAMFPAGDVAGTVSYVDVVFSEPMDYSTFANNDVQITKPDGGAAQVSSVAKLTDSQFRIWFAAQTAFGQYLLQVGPDVRDRAGNLLDQDGNGVAGQPTDAYQARFNLADVDLTVSNVTVGATTLTSGETANISWDGANHTGDPLLGDWTDAVYLSSDGQWDFGDPLLATVPHTGGLAQDATYHQALDVLVPGAVPGDYYLIVRADYASQEKTSGETGRNIAPAGPLALAVHQLSNAGVPAAGVLIAADRSDYYTVHLGPGENLRLNLSSPATAGANEIYVSWGSIPTRSQFDYRVAPGTPDARLTVPATYDGGDCYILVYAAQVTGSQNYSLTGQSYGVIVDRVSPMYQGKAAAATITLTGDGFTQATQVEFLASDGTPFGPTKTTFVSSTQCLVTLDLPNWPVGTYDVRAANPGVAPYTLAAAFQVFAGIGPKLDVNLIAPQAVRINRRDTLWIEYRNTGDAPMPAPMFTVHGSENALLTVDPAFATKPIPADSLPAELTDTVLAWPTGSGATPGTLQPGDSGRIAVYYRGLRQPWPPRDTQNVEFSLGVVEAGEPSAVDWASLKDQVRPEWESADAWNAMWANFTVQVGSTWGDLVQTHSNTVNYLASLGQDTGKLSFDQFLAFAVAQAADVGPSSYLAGGIDAVTLAPGIPLVFSRVFDASFESRYRLGTLGRGWSHNWDYSVSLLSNGDVVVRGPGGADRHFAKNANGTYSPLPGDHATLTLASGQYTLTEVDGTVWQSLGDDPHLLDYVQDTNGNKVTCAYAGGLLTSLTHSNGSQLTMAYDANGRLQKVTDPNGSGTADDKVTTYAYDATGQYLISVTSSDGKTCRPCGKICRKWS